MDKLYTVRYTLPGVSGTFSCKVYARDEADARDTALWGLANQYMADAKITSVKQKKA